MSLSHGILLDPDRRTGAPLVHRETIQVLVLII